MLLNKLKTAILLGITASILTGCSVKALPEQHFQKGDVMVLENKDGTYEFMGNAKNMEFASKYGITYITTASNITSIVEAAYYGKAKGYKYFAMTDKNFNNVLGLPITTINEFLHYCNYPNVQFGRAHNGDCGDRFTTKVIYLKENPKAFPVWNIEEVINEEIDLSIASDDNRKEVLSKFLEENSIKVKK